MESRHDDDRDEALAKALGGDRSFDVLIALNDIWFVVPVFMGDLSVFTNGNQDSEPDQVMTNRHMAVRVCRFQRSGVGHGDKLMVYTVEDFKLLYGHVDIDGKSLPDAWLKWGGRRTYTSTGRARADEQDRRAKSAGQESGQ